MQWQTGTRDIGADRDGQMQRQAGTGANRSTEGHSEAGETGVDRDKRIEGQTGTGR